MPYNTPEKKRAYEHTRVPRRRDWRRGYLRRWRARKRQERAALAAVPEGRSRAIDALRATLRATADAPTRARIQAMLDHAVKVAAGERVKARDPERLRLRPDVGHVGFNVRARPTAGVIDD